MKMIYPDWDQPIIFEENRVNSIYLESPVVFREILMQLLKQVGGEDGPFVLSDGEKIISLSKSMEVILSPFVVNLDDKKFYAQIYKDLQNLAFGEEIFASTQKTMNEARQYLVEILDLMPYDLHLDETMDFATFAKSFGVKILHDEATLADRLIEYITLVKNILNKDIFVLVNVKTYFSQSEIQEIYESLLPKKIHIIDIEQPKKTYQFPYEYDIIIDTDLCEL